MTEQLAMMPHGLVNKEPSSEGASADSEGASSSGLPSSSSWPHSLQHLHPVSAEPPAPADFTRCQPASTLPVAKASSSRLLHLLLEEVVYVHKPQRSVRIGVSFVAVCKLPRGFDRTHSVIKSITRTSIASASSLGVYDVVTRINDVPTLSAKHAVAMIRDATGAIKISRLRCPPWLRLAASSIQRAWRRSKGVSRIVCAQSAGARAAGLVLRSDVSSAAIVSEVHPTSPFATSVNVGDALTAVNGAACRDLAHAESLLLEASSANRLVLLCKAGLRIDIDALLRVERIKKAAAAASTDDCAICLAPPTAPMEWPSRCGHHFCRECVFRCRQQSHACPLCRALPPRSCRQPAPAVQPPRVAVAHLH